MFSESTSLYFFSAWLQANAAILALVGVFIVFKIQALGSAIDSVSGPLYSNLSRINITPRLVDDFAKASLENKGKMLNKFDVLVEPTLQRWISLEKQLKDSKPLVRIPTILLAVGIGIDASLLIVASSIHNSGNILEALILITICIFHIFVMVRVVRLVFELIELSK